MLSKIKPMRKNPTLILIISLLLLSNTILAQLNTINWQKTYGGTKLESSAVIVPKTNNQGYFIVSHSSSDIGYEKTENSFGGSDIWILSIDSIGNILWDKTFGGSANESAADALIINDKLYVLSGSTSPISGNKTAVNYGSSDFWLFCLDFNGQINWQASFGGLNSESAQELTYYNGNLFVFGTSNSPTSGNKTEDSYGDFDYWMVKVDTLDGQIVDQKTIGSTTTDILNDAEMDDFGNIFVLGSSPMGVSGLKSSIGYGDVDYWIVKLDNNLQLLDQQCFGGTGNENAYSGDLLFVNNYFIITGTSDANQSGSINEAGNGLYDAWVFCIDANLNLQWNRLFGGSNSDSGARAIPFLDSSILILSSSSSNVSGNKTAVSYGLSDCWLIALDYQGNEIYQSTIGGSNNDFAKDAISTSNNNLVVLTNSASGISGLKDDFSRGMDDVWIFELNTSNLLGIEENTTNSDNNIGIFPNPTSETLTISLPENASTTNCILVDNLGKEVRRFTVTGGENLVEVSELESGVYMMRIGTDTQKIIIE
jgi:hypothetical protein